MGTRGPAARGAQSDSRRISFRGVRWTRLGPGARAKVVHRGSTQLRLLELTPTFVEEGWCVRGHRGLVLEGSLELQLRTHATILRTGDGLVLESRRRDAHRARALTPRVLLFLVEDA